MAEGHAKQNQVSADDRVGPEWEDTSEVRASISRTSQHASHAQTSSGSVDEPTRELPLDTSLERESAPVAVIAGPGGSAGPRPRRGAPEQTRARLIMTAAHVFNRVPYWEADTNAIAKEAGYSTGTFYRHFKDKREVFIAAYREWIAEEWANIESTIMPGQTPAQSIDRAADALIEHHRRWRVFRGNLRALVTYDEELRELTQALRREQLEKMSLLRMRMGQQPSRTLENDAVHAMMFERVCDGIADGEFKSLGCSVEIAQREFRTLMRQYLLDPWMLD